MATKQSELDARMHAVQARKDMAELERKAQAKVDARLKARTVGSTHDTAQRDAVRAVALKAIRRLWPDAPESIDVPVGKGKITMYPYVWSTGTIGYMASGQKTDLTDDGTTRGQGNFNLFIS